MKMEMYLIHVAILSEIIFSVMANMAFHVKTFQANALFHCLDFSEQLLS